MLSSVVLNFLDASVGQLSSLYSAQEQQSTSRKEVQQQVLGTVECLKSCFYVRPWSQPIPRLSHCAFWLVPFPALCWTLWLLDLACPLTLPSTWFTFSGFLIWLTPRFHSVGLSGCLTQLALWLHALLDLPASWHKFVPGSSSWVYPWLPDLAHTWILLILPSPGLGHSRLSLTPSSTARCRTFRFHSPESSTEFSPSSKKNKQGLLLSFKSAILWSSSLVVRYRRWFGFFFWMRRDKPTLQVSSTSQ